MAAPIIAELHLDPSESDQTAPRTRAARRRIDRQAGRALEILGHAIEYLTDELVHEGGSLTSHDPRVQAVQLLMALNRQIYYQCPEEKDFVTRCLSFIRARQT